MIIHDCIQGTSEWSHLRAGIPTASAFDRIITPKGEPSKQAAKYMYQLLAERIMGHPCIEVTSHWMDRGSQMEAEAVQFYELQRDLDSVKVGFITNDAGTIGASPDRLVGADGLLEIKVPSEAVHVSFLLQAGAAYDEYKIQTQGQLWVAEREWNDLLSYHPEMAPALYRIERDEKFIARMASAVEAFSAELERLTEYAKAQGWLEKSAEQKPYSEQDDLIKAMRDSLIAVKK